MAACILADEKVIPVSHTDIIQKARARIRSRFGPLESRPIIYFFDAADAYWPLTLNSYGSTSFLGYKTCVAIGPNGQSVDVVAHELMHAETATHTGFWSRIRKLPVWFDEGLAMQVDFPERYDLEKGTHYSFIIQLTSSSAFYVSDRELLTKHYGAAKKAVEVWLMDANNNEVYSQLKQFKKEGSFDSIWQATQ